MKKRIEIYSLISGLIFLSSGIAKSLDVSEFAIVITKYGFNNLSFLAPFIVLAEVIIGLLLIFQIRLKQVALMSVLLVIGFTLVYAYGLIFHDIDDCGCFGKITILNTSFTFTFIRNAILIYFFVIMWKNAENKEPTNKWTAIMILIVVSSVSFMLGYGYYKVKRTAIKDKYSAKAIKDSSLGEFISTSVDSTYLVFAFTFSCPHCLNSIENLKQYEVIGVADKVIGIALEDSVAERKFRRLFNPNFPIITYPPKVFFRITNYFPETYYIRNDSIIIKRSGTLPSGYLFKENY